MAIAYWNLILAGRFKFLDLWNKFLAVSFIVTLQIPQNVQILLLQHCAISFAGTPQKINS